MYHGRNTLLYWSFQIHRVTITAKGERKVSMLGQGSVGGGLQRDARASGQTNRDVTGRNRNGKSLALSLFFFFLS